MNKETSARLKKKLADMKISQSKAARMADIPQSSLNLIVNGKLHPCPSWRNRIAIVLKSSEEELFPDCVKEV